MAAKRSQRRCLFILRCAGRRKSIRMEHIRTPKGGNIKRTATTADEAQKPGNADEMHDRRQQMRKKRKILGNADETRYGQPSMWTKRKNGETPTQCTTEEHQCGWNQHKRRRAEEIQHGRQQMRTNRKNNELRTKCKTDDSKCGRNAKYSEVRTKLHTDDKQRGRNEAETANCGRNRTRT